MIYKHIYRISQKEWRPSRTLQENNNEKLYLQITDTQQSFWEHWTNPSRIYQKG